MSSEIDKLLSQQTKLQNLPISYLREDIYPELYQALIQLVEHITKTDEIRKHQERLKRKKVFDKLEQKRVEKEKLKADLGSEYISSDEESMDFDDIGLDKEELEKILQERKKKDDPEGAEEGKDADDSDLIEKQKGQNEEGDPNSAAQNSNNAAKQAEDKGKTKENLLLIEENEEKEEDNEKDIQAEKEKIKNQLKQQREDLSFNPLRFLAEKIRQIHNNQNNN